MQKGATEGNCDESTYGRAVPPSISVMTNTNRFPDRRSSETEKRLPYHNQIQ